MRISSTPIEGVQLICFTPRSDERGSFARIFCDEELSSIIQSRQIRQMNLSRTTAVGAVRGLHYQHPPHSEMKIVTCLKGRVWDLALDLRRGSTTFLQWYATELSPENHLMLVVPEGCAHGFQALESGSELLYLHTARYAPGSEGGVKFDDQRLKITWPLAVTEVSERDQSFQALSAEFMGVL